MHTLARSPVREAHLKSQANLRAFTLIELLTVIGIIAILAAITFGVVKGVNERAAISQAKVELASLSQALEAYKLQYGDYPWAASATSSDSNRVNLYAALNGRMGPKGNAITNGKRFIDAAKFSVVTSSGGNVSDYNAAGNYLVDPWGRQYNYFYKIDPGSGAVAWTNNKSYVLYSYGPTIAVSGTSEPAAAKPNTTGVVDYNNTSNVDNIYANR